MGDCRFCGKPAGFLRKQHGVCADRNERAKESIKTLCVDAALRGADLDGLRPRIRETAAGGFVEMSESKMKRTLAAGWRNAVVEAMEDHVLSTPEKAGLNRYRAQFDLAEKQLNRAGHFELFTKMALLNSLMEHGVIPRTDRRRARTRFGRLPFNLMKSEGLVWMFNNVGYVQQITRREHRGQSMGMSFRVAKGVYVRPGTFRGQSVSTTSMEQTDAGVLGVTTKHIYFKGSEKSFRVRLEKIVSFDPYQDGAGDHAGYGERQAGSLHDEPDRRVVLDQPDRGAAGHRGPEAAGHGRGDAGRDRGRNARRPRGRRGAFHRGDGGVAVARRGGFIGDGAVGML